MSNTENDNVTYKAVSTLQPQTEFYVKSKHAHSSRLAKGNEPEMTGRLLICLPCILCFSKCKRCCCLCCDT